MSSVLLILELLGGLGVFLVGMKMMSEALQRVAGERLKSLLARMTSNRFSGVLTGLGVTSVVQSSSATTVMVIGFVSAGLFTLSQAIGVIMGANIGTTLTGWIVAVVGFKLKILVFALPAVALGVALTFLKRAKPKQWGEVLIGFGILFLGLGLMKDAVPSIDDPRHLAWIQSLTDMGFVSVLVFVGLGAALTVVLQSSSATMTLTLTLAAMGWIPYTLAAAMVLGENIGTTATANIAAIGASTDARRAARVHLLFNLVGVVWALALMKVYWLPVVDLIVPGNPNVDFAALRNDEGAIAGEAAVVTTHLAAAHTVFNITNTGMMLPFVKPLERLVVRWVPTTEQEVLDETRFVSPALIGTPELALVQIGKATQRMTDIVRSMLADARHIMSHPDDDLGPMVETTLSREQEVDQLERQIVDYVTHVAQAPTSEATSRKIAALLQNTHRLERMGDHCAVLVRIARRMHNAGLPFDEEAIEDVGKLYDQVDRSLENVGLYLQGEGDVAESEEIEERVDQTRRTLRSKYIRLMEAGPERRARCLALLDTFTHLEEIGDRAVGIIRRAEQSRSLLSASHALTHSDGTARHSALSLQSPN
ncbi:MAG: Na/Pi cotransporter family protein [Myxococcota bacterium]